MTEKNEIIWLPDEEAIAAVKQKDPKFYAQFSDAELVGILNTFRQMDKEGALEK